MKQRRPIEEAKALLETIHITPRVFTGPKKPSTITFGLITGRIPKDVIDDFRALPGAVSHNVERALRLYLLLTKE